jgi:hypothetical protein
VYDRKGTNMAMNARKRIDLSVVTFDSRSDVESTSTRFDEQVRYSTRRSAATL